VGLVDVWTGFLDGIDFVHDTWSSENTCLYDLLHGRHSLLD